MPGQQLQAADAVRAPAWRALPLCGTQKGIWLADQVSEQKNVYVISHCIVLHGAIDPELLAQAIRHALSEANTVTARYEQQDHGPVQVLGQTEIAPTERFDWRDRPDAEAGAMAWMWDDTRADLPLDGAAPLYRHAVFQLADEGGAPGTVTPRGCS